MSATLGPKVKRGCPVKGKQTYRKCSWFHTTESDADEVYREISYNHVETTVPGHVLSVTRQSGTGSESKPDLDANSECTPQSTGHAMPWARGYNIDMTLWHPATVGRDLS